MMKLLRKKSKVLKVTKNYNSHWKEQQNMSCIHKRNNGLASSKCWNNCQHSILFPVGNNLQDIDQWKTFSDKQKLGKPSRTNTRRKWLGISDLNLSCGYIQISARAAVIWRLNDFILGDSLPWAWNLVLTIDGRPQLVLI